jgi:hypothetical protein
MTVPPGYETWSEVRQRASETWPVASGPKLLGYLVTGELQAWESDAGCNVTPISADVWRKEEWRRLCLARSNDLSSKDKQPVLKTEDLRKLMPTSSEMLDDGMKRHRAKKEAALAAVANRKEESTVAAPASETAMSSGGRPREINWDAMWIEIVRIVYDERIDLSRNKRAAFTKRMLQWFENRNLQVPGDSAMKKKMSNLFKAIDSSPR